MQSDELADRIFDSIDYNYSGKIINEEKNHHRAYKCSLIIKWSAKK